MAESFGDLDPRIDARANDVPPSEFGGFHRIEKALWQEDTAAGMAPVAKQLLADVEELDGERSKTVDLQAVQIANGANELLGEVSASKITGEEERYSHIDLVDFEANVEGAEAAFEAVEPLLDTEATRSCRKRSKRDSPRSTPRLSPTGGRRVRPLHAADRGRTRASWRSGSMRWRRSCRRRRRRSSGGDRTKRWRKLGTELPAGGACTRRGAVQ